MLLLLKYTLLYGSVLMLVALGGMFSERSGIINIALEGTMLIGGLCGTIVLALSPADMPRILVVLVSVLVSALAGLIYSFLLAFSAITLKADQVIGGTALNMMAIAIAMCVAKNINGSNSVKLGYSNYGFIHQYPLLGGKELTINIFFYISIAILVLSWFFMFHTKWGLHLRACGEHPHAADAAGIPVYRNRYIGVLVSGVFAGVGGLAYIVPSVVTWDFSVGVSGFGFLALAVLIFGQWRPLPIFFASMFFAVCKALANIADATIVAKLGLSKNIYDMLPFVASLIVLVFVSKKSKAPKAEGIPYDKGER